MSQDDQERPAPDPSPWWARPSDDVWAGPAASEPEPTEHTVPTRPLLEPSQQQPTQPVPDPQQGPTYRPYAQQDVPERAPYRPAPDEPARAPDYQPYGGPAPTYQPYGQPYASSGGSSYGDQSYGEPRTDENRPYDDLWAGPAAPDTIGSSAMSGDDGRSGRPRTGLLVTVVLLASLLAGAAGGVAGYTLAEREDGREATFDGSNLGPKQTSADVERPDGSIADVAAEVLPSVVQIRVETAQGGATGSGFVVDPDGLLVTNNHVVDGAAGAVEVVFADGRAAEAEVVGTSASYDLAVLRMTAEDLPALEFGNSDAVAVGDPVIAIGSPLGLSGTVTSGIVSAMNRPVTAGGDSGGDAAYINAIQTDAAINPGNSGGPLVNLDGEVIGVNSAIATVGGSLGGESGNIGVGFAIPINQVSRTVTQIIETGEAKFPIIGASLDGRYEGPGAMIASTVSPDNTPPVVPGGPADQAGLEPGDIILEIDGEQVEGSSELIVAIRSRSPGDQVTLLVRRGDSEQEFTVTLGATEG
jgi:putative serine protease PepD